MRGQGLPREGPPPGGMKPRGAAARPWKAPARAPARASAREVSLAAKGAARPTVRTALPRVASRPPALPRVGARGKRVEASGYQTLCLWSAACAVGQFVHVQQALRTRKFSSQLASIDQSPPRPARRAVGQFVHVIRKRIKLTPEKAIFIFVNNVLPPNPALMATIYDEHRDEDGFLYVTYNGESTFGGSA